MSAPAGAPPAVVESPTDGSSDPTTPGDRRAPADPAAGRRCSSPPRRWSRSAAPGPRRRVARWTGGRLRAALTSRLLVAEVLLGVAAASAAAVAGTVAAVGVAVGATALLLAAAAVPWRGVSLVRAVIVLLGFRHRARRHELLGGAGATVPLAVGTRTWAVTDRAGRVNAIVSCDRVLSLVVALVPDTAGTLLQPARLLAVPLDALTRGGDASGDSPLTTRLVVHTVPATTGDPRPARRLAWLTLRLDTVAAHEQARVRGGGALGAARLLTAEAARLDVRLRPHGARAVPLGPDELQAASLAALGAEPGELGERGDGLAERWVATRLGRLDHLVHAVVSWPATLPLGALVDLLARVPADSVTVAVETERAASGTLAEVLVRLSAPCQRIEAARRELLDVAAGTGVRLRPLHGRQLPGLAATTPAGTVPEGLAGWPTPGGGP